jgi:hypothetical protein
VGVGGGGKPRLTASPKGFNRLPYSPTPPPPHSSSSSRSSLLLPPGGICTCRKPLLSSQLLFPECVHITSQVAQPHRLGPGEGAAGWQLLVSEAANHPSPPLPCSSRSSSSSSSRSLLLLSSGSLGFRTCCQALLCCQLIFPECVHITSHVAQSHRVGPGEGAAGWQLLVSEAANHRSGLLPEAS